MMEVHDLWFSLTEDKKIIISIEREGKEFRIKLMRREDLTKPEGEILWVNLQRRGFWENATGFSKTLKAVVKHCPEVSQKNFEDTTKEIANATDFEFSEPEETEPNGITDKSITDSIMKDHLFYCDIKDVNQTLYLFAGDHWSNGVAESTILNELSGIFKEEDKRRGMSLERTTDFIKGQSMNLKVETKPLDLIPFKNGLYDLKEENLKPHDSKYFYVNLIPHNHDPKARCPKWLKFLSEVIPLEKDRIFIQEWVGYNFYEGTPEPAFTILTGVGANGKTVFLKVMSGVIGEDNISAASLLDLTTDVFATESLHHKLANISDDLEQKKITQMGKIKKITSGSKLRVQRKFGQPFDIWPYSKPTWVCNEPPEITDTSQASLNRLQVVEFPTTFAKAPNEGECRARDINELVADLLTEAPGIINWALEGLKRFLRSKSKFTRARSTEETWKFYKRRAQPTVCFIDECLEFTDDPTDFLTRKSLFSAFEEWKTTSKIKLKVTRKKFFMDVRAEGLDATQSRDLDGQRVYKGIKLVTTTQQNITPTIRGESKKSKERESNKEGATLSCFGVTSENPRVEELGGQNLKSRLFEKYGTNPFKMTQVYEDFKEAEVERLAPIMLEMEKKGELVKLPMESGESAWRIVRK